MSFLRHSNLRFLAIFMLLGLLLVACGDDEDSNEDTASEGNGETTEASEPTWDEPIVFGDFNWTSAIFHNRVAQFIAEEGYGFETETIAATTAPMLQGMLDGQVHVVTEMWLENMPDSYHQDVEDGLYVDLGPNYEESIQGWFMPRYVVEGDEERGIEPMAPDLETVEDLPENWEVFQDPEDPEKGRIYHGVAGWEATEITQAKIDAYGLAETYNGFLPGSQAALFTSVQSAVQQGEGWLGYLWAPSWVFAQLDLVQLEEPEYNEECWDQIMSGEEACAFPSVRVHKVITPDLNEGAPAFVEFLENYTSTMESNNDILLHISETGETADEAAIWWLQENVDTWSEWVPDDVAEDVEAALDGM